MAREEKEFATLVKTKNMIQLQALTSTLYPMFFFVFLNSEFCLYWRAQECCWGTRGDIIAEDSHGAKDHCANKK